MLQIKYVVHRGELDLEYLNSEYDVKLIGMCLLQSNIKTSIKTFIKKTPLNLFIVHYLIV